MSKQQELDSPAPAALETPRTGPSLIGRAAIVIGASQGLGREIANHLLGVGADVAICARGAGELEKAAATLQERFPGRKILARACDLGDRGQVDEFYDRALAALGRIDIAINNAGIHGPIGPLEENDWALWERAIKINLVGTAYSCRRAVAHFKSRPRNHRCKIINISGGGATTPQAGLTAYGASKAGLVRFSEALAEEVRPFAIDVNTVAPGALATRLMQELSSAGPDKIGSQYHARIQKFLENGGMPLSRAAELCVYLASAQSDGLTGRLIAAAWDPWPFASDRKIDIETSDIFTLRRILARDRGRDWGG